MKKIIMYIVVYFHRKKMVHSSHYPPAQFHSFKKVGNYVFVLAVITNRYKHHAPNTLLHIPIATVNGFRYIPSRFNKSFIGRLFYKPDNGIVLHPLKFKQ